MEADIGLLTRRTVGRVLLLAPDHERGVKLLTALLTGIPQSRVEVFGSAETLAERLRTPRSHVAIAVLLVLSRDELLRIQSMAALLSDLRLILILPDREEMTIAIGHTLHPRFLSYADRDFSDVTSVLTRMMGRTSEARSQGNDQGGAHDSERHVVFKGNRAHEKGWT